jgi:gamma-glutamyltranspeptidase / glutathione hydrolase
MGGQYQPTGHARLITNLLTYGMDAQSAIDAPRCFTNATGLKLERGYDANVAAGLAALGHKVETSAEPLGGAQAIVIDPENGVLQGASDPRKDGIALGY